VYRLNSGAYFDGDLLNEYWTAYDGFEWYLDLAGTQPVSCSGVLTGRYALVYTTYDYRHATARMCGGSWCGRCGIGGRWIAIILD
jgi:hypothetical protein